MKSEIELKKKISEMESKMEDAWKNDQMKQWNRLKEEKDFWLSKLNDGRRKWNRA